MYKNLGQLCLEKGLITEIQLKLALEHQKKTGLLLGAVLVKLGYITNQEILALLREQREWFYHEKEMKENSPDSDDVFSSEIIILDIITTGINPDTGAEIAQIGFLKILNTEIIEKVTATIKTDKPLSPSFKLLHKLDENTLKEAIPFKQFIPTLSKHISNRPIFTFNAQPAINFIIHHFEKERIPFTHDNFFDLLTVWRRLNKNSGISYLSIIQLAKKLNYEISKPYNIDDSLNAVLHIFKSIIEELRLKKGIRSLEKIKKFQDRKFKFFVPEKTNNYFIIERAIMMKKKLHIDYFSPWANSTTSRTIEPYELINQGNEYYLVAHCSLRKEFRWFRLDRIKNLRMLDEKFEPRDYNKNSIGQ